MKECHPWHLEPRAAFSDTEGVKESLSPVTGWCRAAKRLTRQALTLTAFGLLTAFCLGCSQEESATETPPVSGPVEEAPQIAGDGAAVPTLLTRGQEAAQTLVANLGTQLKAAMEAGGPMAAVGVCKNIAMPLTDATSESFEGLSIRRTSLKVRNPQNAPDALDRQVLERLQAQAAAGKLSPDGFMETPASGGAPRFYKPLIVQELCLNCHGSHETMKPELVTLLEKEYAEDQAHGYQAGDFRGVIRVEFEAE